MLNCVLVFRFPCAALLTAALRVLVGCGGGDNDSAEGAAEASAGAHFAESLKDEPCTLLTPEVVSEVHGVPAAELEVSEKAGCGYFWNGAEMGIGSIEVYENADSARSSFEASTRNMSAEEVAEAMGQVGDQMEEDGAAFYHTTLTVLKGNVTFNIEAYPPGADEAAKRDLAVRLARAVTEHMDEM